MRDSAKYTIATALSQEMIRRHNTDISGSNDPTQRRAGAQAILNLFEHAVSNRLVATMEEITVRQVREMVETAITVLTDQDWLLYSTGLGIAMSYIREGTI